MNEKMGGYAFLAGAILSILAGIFGSTVLATYEGWILLLLVLLGIVVGFLNISDKEINSFLIASIALIAVGTAGFQLIPLVGTYLQGIVNYLAVFVAPAAVIVALKSVYALGRA